MILILIVVMTVTQMKTKIVNQKVLLRLVQKVVHKKKMLKQKRQKR